MTSFPDKFKSQMTKLGLGSDESTKQIWGPIKFVKECDGIGLSNDIDEDLWIDDTLPLEFDCLILMMIILSTWGHISNYPNLMRKKMQVISLMNMHILVKR